MDDARHEDVPTQSPEPFGAAALAQARGWLVDALRELEKARDVARRAQATEAVLQGQLEIASAEIVDLRRRCASSDEEHARLAEAFDEHQEAADAVEAALRAQLLAARDAETPTLAEIGRMLPQLLRVAKGGPAAWEALGGHLLGLLARAETAKDV